MATERDRQATLRSYLQQMTDLILQDESQGPLNQPSIRAAANALTDTVLRTLDGPGNGILIRFLHESELIRTDNPIISLALADLSHAGFSSANLAGCSLSQASLTNADPYYVDLSEADQTGANLTDAHLFRANLTEADLTGAILDDADLTEAILTGARMAEGQIAKTFSVDRAIMPYQTSDDKSATL